MANTTHGSQRFVRQLPVVHPGDFVWGQEYATSVGLPWRRMLGQSIRRRFVKEIEAFRRKTQSNGLVRREATLVC